MGNINPIDSIILWCPIGNALLNGENNVMDQSTGYSILVPYENTGKHYTGEIGVTILLDTGIDLSTATTTQIKVKIPNESTTLWNATVVSGANGINSILEYVTLSGDLYYPGTYQVQPVVAFSNWSGFGEISTFTIYIPISDG